MADYSRRSTAPSIYMYLFFYHRLKNLMISASGSRILSTREAESLSLVYACVPETNLGTHLTTAESEYAYYISKTQHTCGIIRKWHL